MSQFVKNPLIDDKPTAVTASTNFAVTAGDAPPSPIDGKPMIFARCHQVPVFVDMANRVVVPVAIDHRQE